MRIFLIVTMQVEILLLANEIDFSSRSKLERINATFTNGRKHESEYKFWSPTVSITLATLFAVMAITILTVSACAYCPVCPLYKRNKKRQLQRRRENIIDSTTRSTRTIRTIRTITITTTTTPTRTTTWILDMPGHKNEDLHRLKESLRCLLMFSRCRSGH
ncbi:hypothetical protein C0J52_22659 [Blattella germanica]|nr:hypothetical protein C0J52_22659 [Blattella germanica]